MSQMCRRALLRMVRWSQVPLIRVAWGRSGDKGDSSNIGIIARRAEWLPLLREQLSEARVAAWLAHLVHGTGRPATTCRASTR